MGVLKEVIATYIEEEGKIKITETPLIRCGECKKGEETITGKIRCKSSFDGLCMEKDDFCSYGERRTEQSQINTIENMNDKQSEGERRTDE